MKNPYQAIRCLLLIVLLAIPGIVLTDDQASTPVVEVYIFDVAGDLPGFSALVQKARAIARKINPDAQTTLSIYTALAAGPLSDQVTVAVEHQSLSKWGESAEKIGSNPEWQAIAQEFQKGGYTLVSRSLLLQVARER